MSRRLLELTKVKDRISKGILPKGTKSLENLVGMPCSYFQCYREVMDGGMRAGWILKAISRSDNYSSNYFHSICIIEQLHTENINHRYKETVNNINHTMHKNLSWENPNSGKNQPQSFLGRILSNKYNIKLWFLRATQQQETLANRLSMSMPSTRDKWLSLRLANTRKRCTSLV